MYILIHFGKVFLENHSYNTWRSQMEIFLPQWLCYVLFWVIIPIQALHQCNHSQTWVIGCIHAKNTRTWVTLYKCAHQVPYGFGSHSFPRTSRWTHSEVIWATSCREVKPELRKLSLYWLILMAASQSSTELKVLKSGMDLSNSGWEGLEEGEGEEGGKYRAGLWCNIKRGGFKEERNCGYGVCVGVCEEECVCVLCECWLWKAFWPVNCLPHLGVIHSIYLPIVSLSIKVF